MYNRRQWGTNQFFFIWSKKLLHNNIRKINQANELTLTLGKPNEFHELFTSYVDFSVIFVPVRWYILKLQTILLDSLALILSTIMRQNHLLFTSLFIFKNTLFLLSQERQKFSVAVKLSLI